MTLKERFICHIVTQLVDDKEHFKLIIKTHILSQKTSKSIKPNIHSAELINKLTDKMWFQFLNEVKNPKIGVTTAIDNLFKV
jgi:hypothetical protein